MFRYIALACVLAFITASPAPAQTWLTSWYGHDKWRADGKRFDPDDKTVAAHKTLPFGTRLRVSYPRTGRSLTVVVRDRGPYIPGRQLDLTTAAAKFLGFFQRGLARLEVTVLSVGVRHDVRSAPRLAHNHEARHRRLVRHHRQRHRFRIAQRRAD